MWVEEKKGHDNETQSSEPVILYLATVGQQLENATVPNYLQPFKHSLAQKSQVCHWDINVTSRLPGDHPACQSSPPATVTMLSIFTFILFFSLKAKCETLKLNTLKYKYNSKYKVLLQMASQTSFLSHFQSSKHLFFFSVFV